jgi:hypothetical protein
LYAVELERHHLSQRINDGRFCQPRDSHQERVAAGQDANEQLLDHVVLANDNLPDLRAHALVQRAKLVDRDHVLIRRSGRFALGGFVWRELPRRITHNLFCSNQEDAAAQGQS